MLEIYDGKKTLDRRRLGAIMFCAYVGDAGALEKEIKRYLDAINQNRRDVWTDAVEAWGCGSSAKGARSAWRIHIWDQFVTELAVSGDDFTYERLMDTRLVDALIGARSESEIAASGSLAETLAKRNSEENEKLYDRTLETLTGPKDKNGFGFSRVFAEEIIERFYCEDFDCRYLELLTGPEFGFPRAFALKMIEYYGY